MGVRPKSPVASRGPWRATLLVLTAALLSLCTFGCIKKDLYAPHPCERPDMGGCLIDEVAVKGNSEVATSAIKEKIATSEINHSLFGGFIEDVPIVSLYDRLTVEYGVFDKARGRMVGSEEFLTKPFSKDQLLAAVEKFAAPTSGK